MWSKLKARLLLAGPAGAPGQLFLCHGDLLPKQENDSSRTPVAKQRYPML
jgi:hypothetical protein